MAAKTSLVPALKQSRGAMVRAAQDHTDLSLLEFQSPTAALIAEPVPVMARATSYLITALVISCMAVMFFVKVDRIVTAPALVVSQASNIVVQPLETSIVRAVLVREGETVRKGQLLAELDPTISGGDDLATTAQADSLQAEVDRLRAELGNRTYTGDGTSYSQMQALMFTQRQQQYTFHVDGLRQKIESARAKVDQYRADEASLLPRLQGAQQLEAMRRELERQGNGSKINTLSATDTRLQIGGQLEDARKQLVGAQQDLAGAIADLNDYVHQWKSDTSQQLSQQERSLSDMIGQSTKNRLRHRLVELRAPHDAVVLSVARVSVGTVMQSGDEFLRLVPADSPLEIEGLIDGSDMGYMKVGDPVTIKFDTLPYILYGTASGTVESVSPGSFTQGRMDPTPELPKKPETNGNSKANTAGASPVYYRVRMSIRHVDLRDPPAGFRIAPGMPVTADVKVGERSTMDYFFQRILPSLTEGMREP